MMHGGEQARGSRSRSLLLRISQLQIEHLWILLPAFLVTWMGFMHPLRRLDFWWHLKVGQVILTSRKIPQVDLFSFTQAGRPFIYQNWLGEVLYYLTYRAGGLQLLILFNTVLLLCSFLPILHLCLQANVQRRVGALCSLVAAFVLGMYSNVRPQVYSFVLFAAFYWILCRHRDGRRDLTWVLPLLMVLWVNLHGAFVLGIGLIAIFLGGETVRRLWYGPRADVLTSRALARLALILVLTLLAILANPQGYHVFAYVRQLQVDPSSQALVTEWQVPDIKQLNDVLVFFGPLFLSLLVLFYARGRLNLTELGLFFGFAIFGVSAMRNAIWFALVVAPLLARHLAGPDVANLPTGTGAGADLARLVARLKRPPQQPRANHYRLNWAILIGLLLLTVLLSPWVRPHLNSERLRPQLVEQGTPVGAMDYIAAHGLTGNIFHPQDYGDYLIWRLWPQQRSFIDGRVHLYPLKFVEDYVLALHDDQWESRLAQYDIRFLLLPKGDASFAVMIRDAQSSPRWKLLYEDNVSVLFEGVVVAER
jgi:hypothetical protein